MRPLISGEDRSQFAETLQKGLYTIQIEEN